MNIHLFTTSRVSAVAGVLAFGSLINSTPMNNPTPRTSPITSGNFSCTHFNSDKMYSPTSFAFSIIFSLSTAYITEMAMAHDTGFPPYCKTSSFSPLIYLYIMRISGSCTVQFDDNHYVMRKITRL